MFFCKSGSCLLPSHKAECSFRPSEKNSMPAEIWLHVNQHLQQARLMLPMVLLLLPWSHTTAVWNIPVHLHCAFFHACAEDASSQHSDPSQLPSHPRPNVTQIVIILTPTELSDAVWIYWELKGHRLSVSGVTYLSDVVHLWPRAVQLTLGKYQ